MACKSSCRLCKRLVISTSVTFADNNLVITIPSGNYENGEKYCIVVAQNIPTTTTISAPVVVQIGTGTQLYPLQRCNCSQATACNIRSRTRYSTRVATNATGGAFRLIGNTCCAPNNSLNSINGTAPVATTDDTTEGGN